MLWNYLNSKHSTLWDAYDNPSREKKYAWDWCRNDMYDHNGYDMRITSHNTFVFTCAYAYDICNGDTGEITEIRLRYHTPMHVYDFEITDYAF